MSTRILADEQGGAGVFFYPDYYPGKSLHEQTTDKNCSVFLDKDRSPFTVLSTLRANKWWNNG